MSHRLALSLSFSLFALATLTTLPAHAGRPLQTEDAGVLDRGDCELELVVSRERNEQPAVTAARGQLGCGLGLQSQLALFLGRARDGGERSDVVGLTGKTYLRPLREDATGLAIAWASGFQRPRGGGTERDVTEVRAVVTHPVGPWLLHGNLGWARSTTEHRNSTVWGAAVERVGLGPIDAMVEVFGDDRDRPWANAGLRWPISPGKLFLDGSYGRQLRHDGASLFTIGLKLAF